MLTKSSFIAVIGVICWLLCLSSAAHATQIVYDVTGWIDTTDDLYIRGNSVHWEHPYPGSPAGTHGATEQPTVISSWLEGTQQMSNVNWSGMWTGFSVSLSYTSLTPTLSTSSDSFAAVEKISGRGSLSIIQQPDVSNNYTLGVKFKDGFNGAAFLDAKITVVPEPSTCGVVLIFGILGMRPNRSRQPARFR